MKNIKTIINLVAILVLILAAYALVDGIKSRLKYQSSNSSDIKSASK